MNTDVIAPEVQDFLDVVRSQLVDLDADEQREILDGLEADLTDLVAERGGEALGDPVSYARELRAAAGLEPEMHASRAHRPVPERIHAVLDASAERWGQILTAAPGNADEFLTTLRPVWWVLRAWLAVETVALALGVWALTIIPGSNVAGVGAIAAAVFLSVQLGRGLLWPAERWRRAASLRVLLLGLNVLAVVMIPGVLDGLQHGRNGALEAAYAQATSTASVDGLQFNGEPVRNIYPYDAQGHPLVGVQLFDQVGQPINVVTEPEYIDDIDDANEGAPKVSYPWTNGAAQLFNVFPIPTRVQDSEEPSPTAFTEASPPTIGPFPLAAVPQVSLPGITPSVLPADR